MLERFYPMARRRGGVGTRRPKDIFDLMQEVVDTSFSDLYPPEGSFPAVDVSETDNSVTVTAEIPGMKPEDIDLSIENDTLVIQGEKKQEQRDEKENRLRVERSYGSFYRAVPLPCKCKEEDIKASFKNGVLSVEMPKETEQARGKKISIES